MTANVHISDIMSDITLICYKFREFCVFCFAQQANAKGLHPGGRSAPYNFESAEI
jgi:hypothetical protein